MPDDVTGNASVIDAWNTVSKERFDTLQLVFGKIKQGTHGTPPRFLHILFPSLKNKTSPDPKNFLDSSRL